MTADEARARPLELLDAAAAVLGTNGPDGRPWTGAMRRRVSRAAIPAASTTWTSAAPCSPPDGFFRHFDEGPEGVVDRLLRGEYFRHIRAEEDEVGP